MAGRLHREEMPVERLVGTGSVQIQAENSVMKRRPGASPYRARWNAGCSIWTAKVSCARGMHRRVLPQ